MLLPPNIYAFTPHFHCFQPLFSPLSFCVLLQYSDLQRITKMARIAYF